MKFRIQGTLCDLAYCQNVHPGESWQENQAALKTYVPALQSALDVHGPFGVGLRLSRAAAETLLQPDALRRFQEQLKQHRQYVFTINGFPYGTFHGQPVKTAVYRPDWRQPERLAYTMMLARILSELVPAGASGSISTVPGGLRAWFDTEADRQRMAVNLAEAAAGLQRLSEQAGSDLHLGLEPEPDCFLETTTDCVRFFQGNLERWAVPHLARLLGIRASAAQERLRQRIGICVDTCHLAVQYEDLVASIRGLADQGIRISKFQLSAALRTALDSGDVSALHAFVNPVYLHQVKARQADGTVAARGDLADALATGPDPAQECEWRVHCHVPLYVQGDGTLVTTADQITPDVLRAAVLAGVRHFEIETYTFPVLPDHHRKVGLVQSLLSEYRWLLNQLPANAERRPHERS